MKSRTGTWLHRLGDTTAKDRGRLSLNPCNISIRFGTLVLLLTFLGSQGSMMFGWAKPVPINPGHFKNHQHGMALGRRLRTAGELHAGGDSGAGC